LTNTLSDDLSCRISEAILVSRPEYPGLEGLNVFSALISGLLESVDSFAEIVESSGFFFECSGRINNRRVEASRFLKVFIITPSAQSLVKFFYSRVSNKAGDAAALLGN